LYESGKGELRVTQQHKKGGREGEARRKSAYSKGGRHQGKRKGGKRLINLEGGGEKGGLGSKRKSEKGKSRGNGEKCLSSWALMGAGRRIFI